MRISILACGVLLATTCAAADYQAGLRAYNAKDYGTALKEWLPLAEQGNEAAQNSVGFMYERGLGAPQDYSGAAKWYQRAAERGYGPAAYNLGLLYRNGRGVPRDEGQATHWFEVAAEKGVDLAQLNLGNSSYKAGKGDMGQSTRYWRMAAEHGNAVAAYNLAYLYSQGQGVQRSYEDAAKWYRVAANQGYGLAQYALALLYEKGLGVPVDRVEAYKWLELAARSGVKHAQDEMRSLGRSMPGSEIAKAHQAAEAWGPRKQTTDAAERAYGKIQDQGPGNAEPVIADTGAMLVSIGDPGASVSHEPAMATGFVVNAEGYVVTSDQPAQACENLIVKAGDHEQPVRLKGRDSKTGLAVVGPLSGKHEPLAIAVRAAPGDKVTEIGFDVRQQNATAVAAQGSLHASGASPGTFAFAGHGGAPNGGGPILDQSGRVVALAPPDPITSSSPPDVNTRAMAIGGGVIARFLERHGVAYSTKEDSNAPDTATRSVVLVECKR